MRGNLRSSWYVTWPNVPRLYGSAICVFFLPAFTEPPLFSGQIRGLGDQLKSPRRKRHSIPKGNMKPQASHTRMKKAISWGELNDLAERGILLRIAGVLQRLDVESSGISAYIGLHPKRCRTSRRTTVHSYNCCFAFSEPASPQPIELFAVYTHRTHHETKYTTRFSNRAVNWTS